MKLFTVLLMVGLAGCAWGQTNCHPTEGKPGFVTCDPTPKPPKPLKCGKYEHAVSVYSQLTDFKLRDECAPIMHEVTEKDWQELLARLKALEKQLRGEGGMHF